MKPFFIIVSGPTGVGKTDFINMLESIISTPVAIINGDMGQMYVPFSIGTAKPNWKIQKSPHYLFDIINEPTDFTVFKYNKLVNETMVNCWKENRLPIIVGGSGFYLKSLFFPSSLYELRRTGPTSQQANTTGSADTTNIDDFCDSSNNEDLWQKLYKIDPKRANAINKNDIYRIERAINLWRQTGQLPSSFEPKYRPPADYLFYFLNRNIDDLYERINIRVKQMFEFGWIDEVKNLSQEWKDFLQEKKLIGYAQIIAFLKKEGNIPNNNELINLISTKTRNYAKRQLTFWRFFSKMLKDSKICEINLTLVDLKECLKDLDKKIKEIYDENI